MANTPPPASVRSNGPSSVRSQPVSSPPSGVLRATEARASDSGVVDLAAAAASDPMGAVRAQSTPLASSPLFDDEDARSSQPPTSKRPSQAPMSAPALSGPAASAVLAAQPAAREGKKSPVLIMVGGLAMVAAIAAGAFFVVKTQSSKRQAQVAAAAVPAGDAKPGDAKPVVVQPEPAATAAAVAAAATPSPDKVDDPANDPVKGSVGGGKLSASAAVPNAAAATATAPKRAAGGPRLAAKADGDKVDPKLVAKDLPAPPAAPGPTGALADAIKQSAAPTPTPASQDTAPLPPAANDPAIAAGSVPQKPSQGAVTGALGSALPAARGCLKPDDPVSRAAVTFGSNGSVQSVVVSGSAAGKPAEACIKSALGKAKVPAFAMPTYSANVTVRPAN